MFDAVVVVGERASGVVGWVNHHAFNFASKLSFQGFQSQEVIAKDEAIIEQVGIGHAVLGVVAALGVLQQDTRFQSVADFLTDPGKFKSLSWHGIRSRVCEVINDFFSVRFGKEQEQKALLQKRVEHGHLGHQKIYAERMLQQSLF